MGGIARWRRRRELERRMRELDRVDARLGLGAMPPPRPPRRIRSGRGITAWLLSLAVVLGTVVALAYTPGRAGSVVRSVTGLNNAQRPLAAVRPGTTGGSYAFLATRSGGEPVTYDPCRVIRVEVNPARGPDDHAAFIAPALREVEAASGLRLELVGTTQDTWSTRRRVLRRLPLLITFNLPAEVSGLAGDVVGLGGSNAVELPGRTRRYVSGSIALDATWFVDASTEGRRDAQQSVVMHELGHVLGLDHVQDPGELMAESNTGQTTFGPGDRQGLALLGAGPCD